MRAKKKKRGSLDLNNRVELNKNGVIQSIKHKCFSDFIEKLSEFLF